MEEINAIIPEEEECIEQAETSMIIPTDSVTVRDSQDENQQANTAKDDLDQDNISFLESSPPRLKKPKAQSTPIKAVPAPKMDDISFKSSYNVNYSGSDIIESDSSEKVNATTNERDSGTSARDNVTVIELDNNTVRSIPNKLPGGHWLEVEKAYNLIKNNNEQDILPEIPMGNKSNCYFLVDFSSNQEQLRKNKKCDYYDDCGVWDSKKGTTCNTYYVVENGILRLSYLKNGVYCVRKKEKGKTVFVPLSPQPLKEHILKFHRSYSVLKANSQFKKRVSYVIEGTNELPNNVALVEYSGEYINFSNAHGNSKRTDAEYLRTHPKVFQKMAEEVKNKKPREIYYEMVKEDSFNAPKDFKQVRDKKHAEKKKQKKNRNINIADDIAEGIALIDSEEIVQEVIISKGKSPSFILYTENQVLDIKYFLANNKNENAKLGIDRTFNLGPFFVTALVYKNLRLTRQEDEKTHPIFLGPMLLHRQAQFKDYHVFLSNVKAALATSVDAIDIRIPKDIDIGSDDERALTNAIDSVFPSANRALCTKHLKDNVSHYLQNKVGVPVKERRTIIGQLFGEDGLVSADDSFQFEEKAQSIENSIEKYPQFLKYFRKLKDRIQNHVVEINGTQTNKNGVLWTNNNCESINHIMKLDTNWMPENTVTLIEKLHNIVKLHFIDYRRALYGSGNYRLIPSLSNCKIPTAKWIEMSNLEKDIAFRDFLNAKKKQSKHTQIVSRKLPQLTVPSHPKIAKKPGQKRRPKAERTRPVK